MHAQGSSLNIRRGEEDYNEYRRHHRFSCSEETHFFIRSRLHEGTLKNFSRGGTYIATEGLFFVGQEITVAGPFDPKGRETKKDGAIVRCDREGIGIKFVSPIA